jgi:hypothetical protein
MSTNQHPVGRPTSPRVYRRRRFVALLGLLAVLVIIILIVTRPGSTPTTTPGPAASASPDAETSSSGAACDPSVVQVESLTDALEYGPGELPQLSLSVTNTGPTACTLNAGTSVQLFTITSGSDVWWRSTDCQTGAADAPVVLEPNVPLSSTTAVPWERVRSAPSTCADATRSAAPAGGASYVLTVTVDGIESASPKQFFLY